LKVAYQNGASIEQIIDLGVQVCETLPDLYLALCKSGIHLYSPLIISGIEQNLNTTFICQETTFCPFPEKIQ
jgi:hypothetical protein